MTTPVVLPRPPHVVDAARAAVVPFSLGALSFCDGATLDACPYEGGTPDAERWVDGWTAARSTRETERLDDAQALADAHGVTGADRRVLLAVALLGDGHPGTLADPARATPAFVRAALHRLAGLGLVDAKPAPTSAWGFTWRLTNPPVVEVPERVQDLFQARRTVVLTGKPRGMCPVCNSVLYHGDEECAGCVIGAALAEVYGDLRTDAP